MSRPITLFTGQWADLRFEEVCRLASGWGYDGLEIACWGDHLDVNLGAFGLNWDPSHFVWQDLDPVGFILEFADRIYHVDCKDVKLNVGNGRNGRLGSHLAWADLRRGWDFVSTGHGDVPWEKSFRALNAIGYSGPISVEWEDAGMDRLVGAPEALAFVRRLAFDPPAAAFDAAFASGN